MFTGGIRKKRKTFPGGVQEQPVMPGSLQRKCTFNTDILRVGRLQGIPQFLFRFVIVFMCRNPETELRVAIAAWVESRFANCNRNPNHNPNLNPGRNPGHNFLSNRNPGCNQDCDHCCDFDSLPWKHPWGLLQCWKPQMTVANLEKN